jgi:hypothetical protein
METFWPIQFDTEPKHDPENRGGQGDVARLGSSKSTGVGDFRRARLWLSPERPGELSD